MIVISFFLLDHHRKRQVNEMELDKGSTPGSSSSESGLILTASTVVLTDERISRVGDPHAITTSCLHVDLVDISSNAFSDWHEVLFIDSNKTNRISTLPMPVVLDITSPLIITSCENNQS